MRLLEDRRYEFNVQVTGISDGKFFAWLLKETNGVKVGGVLGWPESQINLPSARQPQCSS
jgi:hypothetical protein